MSPNSRMRGEYINQLNIWKDRKAQLSKKSNDAEEEVRRIRRKWNKVQFYLINQTEMCNF